MQLIVLGMHRSGTSVLARLLNLMGAYFGPEGISTGANPENPKGFWERRDVRELNDTVLHAMGWDWDRVSGFDPDQVPDAVAADFRVRASKLLLEMDAHRPWFLKEPRLCLLFPLWRKLLEAPVCIHIFRHPVEVASSLNTRNGIPIDTGLALWERYTQLSLRASAGIPSVTVSHRRLMEQPAEEANRLFKALEALEVTGLRMPPHREINAFVVSGLYRERESRDDLRAYERAPQVQLFRHLEAGKLPSRAHTARSNAGATRSLAAYEADLPPLPAGRAKAADPVPAIARNEEVLALKQRADKLKADLVERDDRITRLKADLAARDERIVELTRENRALQVSTQALRIDFEASKSRLAERDGWIGRLEREISRLSATLEERDRRLQSATSEHEALLASRNAIIDRLGRREALLERHLADRLDDVGRLTSVVIDLAGRSG